MNGMHLLAMAVLLPPLVMGCGKGSSWQDSAGNPNPDGAYEYTMFESDLAFDMYVERFRAGRFEDNGTTPDAPCKVPVGMRWYVQPRGKDVQVNVVEMQRNGVKHLGVDYWVTGEALQQYIHLMPELEGLFVTARGRPGTDELDIDEGLIALADLERLEVLYLQRRKLGPVSMGYVGNVKSLRELNLNHSYVTDDGVEALSGLKSVETLRMFASVITDEGVAHLAKLTSLRHLTFSGAKVTDAGLAHLSVLGNLRELKVSRMPHMTDEGLKHVAGITSLKSLSLPSSSQITSDGLKHLETLNNLRSLSIPGTLADEVGMAHVAKLPNLRELHITGRDCGDRVTGLAELAAAKNLTSLSVSPYWFGDQHAAQLVAVDSLEEMDLRDCKITDEGMKSLGELPNLRVLSLQDANITDVGLAHLAGLPIEELDLWGTGITGAGLAHLSGMPGMRVLDLGLCEGVTDAGLAHLSGMKDLEKLDLQETSITDAGLVHLSGLVNLRELDLGYTGITDAGLIHLMNFKAPRHIWTGKGVSKEGDQKLEVRYPHATIH